MDEIKFKGNKLEIAAGILGGTLGLIVLLLNETNEGSVMGMLGLLLALHFFNSSGIYSIKKYLNEERRKNGIK